MNLWKSIQGMISIQLHCPDPVASVSAINKAGIDIYDLETVDPVTMTFQISRCHLKQLKSLTEKRGDCLRVVGKTGFYWTLQTLKHRPVLVVGLIVLLTAALFLPTRIFFVKVEGNHEIPTRVILEQAELCGIRFGTSRRAVRSERMKNALLSAIPQLQWAGINTYGCTALISVRERTETEMSETKPTVSRIVALRDGVITQCTVTRGNPLCKVGQAVKAGETLVSGYTDCGLTIRAERAEAEVFGQTNRTITSFIPTQYMQSGVNSEVRKKYSLIIGKKRINLWKDSGISGTTCAKMYREYSVTLWGDFVLPIKLAVETMQVQNYTTMIISTEEAERLLRDFSRQYLLGHMTAGQILEEELSFTQEQNLVRMTGEYACHELIGQEQSEEIINRYEQTS